MVSSTGRRSETRRCCIECCCSSVWTLFCCSRCPLLTPQNISLQKFIGQLAAASPLNTPNMRFQIRPEPGLSFILPLIAMLTKEPEMLQTDAFCEHTMQQHATVAGAGSLAGGLQVTTLSRSSSWFKGVASWRSRKETGRNGRRVEEMDRKGGEGEEMLTLMRSCCQTA